MSGPPVFACFSVMNCVVPENIHTPPTEGIEISWGMVAGLYETKQFKEMYDT